MVTLAPEIDGLQVEIGGDALAEFQPPETEFIGLAFAVEVLIIAFGSVLAMSLPLAAGVEVDSIEAVKSGALGYLLKDLGADAFFEALDAVEHGESMIPPRLTRHLISENTVKFHMRGILEKLHLHNRTEVAVWVAAQVPPGGEQRTGQ